MLNAQKNQAQCFSLLNVLLSHVELQVDNLPDELSRLLVEYPLESHEVNVLSNFVRGPLHDLLSVLVGGLERVYAVDLLEHELNENNWGSTFVGVELAGGGEEEVRVSNQSCLGSRGNHCHAKALLLYSVGRQQIYLFLIGPKGVTKH